MRARRGAILIVVLWLSVILSITAAGLAYAYRSQVYITRNQMERGKAYAIARGGVESVIGILHQHGNDKTHTPKTDWWSGAELHERIPLGEGFFSIHPRLAAATGESAQRPGEEIGLADMESRLNVNTVPERVLARLKGLPPEIASAIVRVREERKERDSEGDSLVTTLAEAREEEERADRQVVNAPFRTLRDLLQVPGVTEAMLFGDGVDEPGLSAVLTTESSGKVNVHSASREVLMALGVAERKLGPLESQASTVRGFADLEQFLEVSGLAAEPLGERSSASTEEKAEHLRTLRTLLSLRSSNFSLVSIGQGPLGARVAIEAVLSVGEEKVRVTSWCCTWLPPVTVREDMEEAGARARWEP